MKGLFVGQLGRGQTCAMRSAALSRLGFEMTSIDSGGIWNIPYLRRHVDQRLTNSGTVRRFNDRVLDAVKREKPDFFWGEKQEYLSADVLKAIRDSGALTIHYNPDPYYSLAWKQTRHTEETLSGFDVLVVTKQYELAEYAARNRASIIYSPLGYDRIAHRRTTQFPPAFAADLGFVGGWEPQRERMIIAAKRAGHRVKVWGYGWRISQQSITNPLRALRLGRLTLEQRPYFGRPHPELDGVVQPGESGHGEIYEELYAASVAASSISLGFLREICPDQHTTRSFEIPAMGGFLLANRTDEHQEFFTEGEEAEYFDSEQEFLDKAAFYLRSPEKRQAIAEAGYRRCLSSGYSYDERLAKVMTELDLFKKNNGAQVSVAGAPTSPPFGTKSQVSKSPQ